MSKTAAYWFSLTVRRCVASVRASSIWRERSSKSLARCSSLSKRSEMPEKREESASVFTERLKKGVVADIFFLVFPVCFEDLMCFVLLAEIKLVTLFCYRFAFVRVIGP